jgi:hypothetical protein
MTPEAISAALNELAGSVDRLPSRDLKACLLELARSVLPLPAPKNEPRWRQYEGTRVVNGRRVRVEKIGRRTFIVQEPRAGYGLPNSYGTQKTRTSFVTLPPLV